MDRNRSFHHSTTIALFPTSAELISCAQSTWQSSIKQARRNILRKILMSVACVVCDQTAEGLGMSTQVVGHFFELAKSKRTPCAYRNFKFHG